MGSPTKTPHTLMYTEASQAGAVVQKQINQNQDKFRQIGVFLRENPPKFAVTVGRGSSDHAAVYARYLIETQMGVITSPAGLSVSSVYGAPLHTEKSLCIAISQSGQSPDLVATVRDMHLRGAYAIALINAENSPLASCADQTIPLCAGPEKSVAATKSFITSMSAVLQIVAHWKNDKPLLELINNLPQQLEAAWALDWSAAIPTFTNASNLFVLGRGLGYGLTREAALKFKETCSLHAESYSSAEVLHGPAAIIKNGFPILAFAQNDETKIGLRKTLDTIAQNGGNVFVAGLSNTPFTELPTIDAHPLIQPILMAQSFYKMVNAVALTRGYNPDAPANLSKVTETV